MVGAEGVEGDDLKPSRSLRENNLAASFLRPAILASGERWLPKSPGRSIYNNPKTVFDVAAAWNVHITTCRPAALRVVDPRTAPYNAQGIFAAFSDAWRLIIWSPLICLVPLIFYPLPDISMHIMSTPRIRLSRRIPPNVRSPMNPN